MWHYVRKYLHFAVIAALLMVGEVCMDLVQPSLMSTIVDKGVLGVTDADAGAGVGAGVGGMDVILSTGLVMVVAAVFGGACGSGNNVFANMCVQNIGNLMRKDTFSRIMGMSFSQVDRFSAGSLITRVTNDITQVEMYVETFIRGVIRTGLMMVGSIWFMFQLNEAFGLLTLAAFPVALVLLVACLRKATPLFARLQGLLDQVNSVMQEDLGGIRTIKACVREAAEKKRFGAANAKLVATQLRALLIFAMLNPAMNCLMYVVVAVLLWMGGYQTQDGAITPGIVMAAITYATQLLGSILRLVMLSQELSRGSASWARVKEVLGCRSEFEAGAGIDAASAAPVPASGAPAASIPMLAMSAAPVVAAAPGALAVSPAPAAEGLRVEFENVTFSFPAAESPVLEGVTFDIGAGQTVVIMGPTGCGKTTLTSLIPRFYDVSSGAVRVDGVDVRAWSPALLRDKVAVALQSAELFGATIADNIAWGRPFASLSEIEGAARVAQAHEFIMRTPQGYDTPLGQRGMSLSGGQRQRLALARMVLKAAPVMILDDATSALDLQTEACFLQALDQAAPHATKIMVVQRVASARHADKIVLLDGRRVAGVGTHQELLASNALYQEICASQFGSVDELEVSSGKVGSHAGTKSA